METARIDKTGVLMINRSGKDLSMECPLKTGPDELFYCSHNCPGWKETNEWQYPNMTLKEGLFVTLCAPMDVTYEIVEDERRGLCHSTIVDYAADCLIGLKCISEDIFVLIVPMRGPR
jgi:hypothetical protein